MIKILVADDHQIVREGIRALLEAQPGWHVCDEATTGREALEKAIALRPEIIVLDVSMPEMNGLEAARQIHRAMPAAKILALTVHDIDELVQDFVEAGASGYVLKADTGAVIVDAVTTLLHGGMYFTRTLQHGKQEWSSVSEVVPSIPRLTPREREVLQLLAEGKSNKEIGTLLSISTKTAETHRARLMSKLHVHSIADLVRYAIRNQIVDA
jgi:DNA-binding NarL/FixJ family response regulator